MNNEILDLAEKNQKKAWSVVEATNVVNIWKSVGAEINLVGSLKTGLLMTHRDIDFHIYTSPIVIADSFRAMSKLAENPRIKRIEYGNLIDTEERCVEWHAWYQDDENNLWQLDMIHIEKGSRYDGFFENFTDRLSAVLTSETKNAILQIKMDTPEEEKIMGIEYYLAVIRDGIRNYDDFAKWRKTHSITGVEEWTP